MPEHNSRRSFLAAGATLVSLPIITQLSSCRENNQHKPAKKIFTDPKFELIDLALQHEFGAIVQYGNHAGVIAALHLDNEEANTFSNTVRDIINEEIHHAILLTEIMTRNSHEPSVAVWPPQTGKTTQEMLQKDIAAEAEAVKLYEQILSLDFDDSTKQTIEAIKHAEVLHQNLFSSLLPDTG